MRILIVDDDYAVRIALARLLGVRHEVTTAAGYQDALAQLRASTFDVVLCDVLMPDGSGLALFAEAQRVRPELEGRFVLMTGGAISNADVAALEATRAEVIAKPFDIGRLEETLRRIAR